MNINTLAPSHTTYEGRERGRLLLFLAIFLVVSTLAALDLVADIGEGASLFHLAVEGLLLLSGLFGIFTMIRALQQVSARARTLHTRAQTLRHKLDEKSAEARALNDQLSQSEAQARQWQHEVRELMRGLGAAIDQQFDRWDLTEAEKEVALLLLKGLSHKEVAALRDTSDATTRQQARAVYKKGGLSGRNELSAFFLEDLLLPRSEAPADAP